MKDTFKILVILIVAVFIFVSVAGLLANKEKENIQLRETSSDNDSVLCNFKVDNKIAQYCITYINIDVREGSVEFNTTDGKYIYCTIASNYPENDYKIAQYIVEQP